MRKTGGEMHQFFHRLNLNTDKYWDFYPVRGKSKKSNLDFVDFIQQQISASLPRK